MHDDRTAPPPPATPDLQHADGDVERHGDVGATDGLGGSSDAPPASDGKVDDAAERHGRHREIHLRQGAVAITYERVLGITSETHAEKAALQRPRRRRTP